MMHGTLIKVARSVRIFLILGLAVSVPLLAQEQAAVVWHGLLRNSEGAPIAGAKVLLSGEATAQANTIDDGSFTLSALPAGQYRLTITAEGRTVPYAESVALAPGAPAVAITLSSRGEISMAAQPGVGATGGEALSSQ